MQRIRRTPQIEKYLDGEELAAFRHAYAAITGGTLAAPQAAGAHAAIQAGQLLLHPTGGNVVSLSAFRAARKAEAIQTAGSAGDAW